MKYEDPKLSVVYFASEDIIRTSGEKDFKDENVDDDGWL